MSQHCEGCGLPESRCICDPQACYKCDVVGCEGECDELDLTDDSVEPLNFDHDADGA